MSLTLAQKENLTRLIEAGVNRSAELLGKMSRTQWGIMASSLNEMPVVRLLSWFERDHGRYIGTRLTPRDLLPMQVLILFSDTNSRVVAEAVTRPYASKLGKLPDLVKLTIGEVSNVLAQAIVSSMADSVDMELILSVPEVLEETKSHILSTALEDYDGRNDLLMISHVDLYSENLSAECSVLVIINEDLLQRILAH